MWTILALLILLFLVANSSNLLESFKPSKWCHHRTGCHGGIRPYDNILEFPYFLHPYDYVDPFPYEYEYRPYDLGN